MRARTFAQLVMLLGALTVLPATVGAENGKSETAGNGKRDATGNAPAGNGAGSQTATSTAAVPPGQQPPSNVVPPSISGTAALGRVLTASPGTWNGNGIGFAYQWQRCSPGTTACASVSGAVATTHTVVSGDAGYALRVLVTATNKNGSAQAVSGQTATVAPPPAPAPTTTTTTTTTAPAVSGTVYFNGRAKNMTTLYSTSSTNYGQSPTVWDCLCFLNNDIALASDARYGKVYATRAGVGSHSAWYTPGPGIAAAEISKRRPNDLGKWDWFAQGYKVSGGFSSQIGFIVLTQFGYPTLSSPPLGIYMGYTNGVLNFQLFRNAGLLTNRCGWYCGQVLEQPSFLPVPLGKWVDIIVGVKWANDSTGEIRVYTRTEGQSDFTLRLTRSGTPTWQYGTTSYGTVNANGTNTSGQQVGVLDKQGLYFGYWDSRSSFPTESLQESGLVRASDYATARATLP
jgi:hypothetical protein